MDIWFILIVGGGTLATIIWLWKALFPRKTVTKKRLVPLYPSLPKERRWNSTSSYESSYLYTDFDHSTSDFSSSSSDFDGFSGGDSGGSGGGGNSD